jgi:hypothetical protein
MSNASQHAQSKDPYKPIAASAISGNPPQDHQLRHAGCPISRTFFARESLPCPYRRGGDLPSDTSLLSFRTSVVRW